MSLSRSKSYFRGEESPENAQKFRSFFCSFVRDGGHLASKNINVSSFPLHTSFPRLFSKFPPILLGTTASFHNKVYEIKTLKVQNLPFIHALPTANYKPLRLTHPQASRTLQWILIYRVHADRAHRTWESDANK